MMTDPIADFLARIRNAALSRHRNLSVPGSKMKMRLAEILRDEGYLDACSWTDDGKQGVVHMTIKYDETGRPVIEGLQRISKPGRRVYVGVDALPRVRSGLGTVVVSTSQGVMTGRDARARRIGGEVLFQIW